MLFKGLSSFFRNIKGNIAVEEVENSVFFKAVGYFMSFSESLIVQGNTMPQISLDSYHMRCIWPFKFERHKL